MVNSELQPNLGLPNLKNGMQSYLEKWSRYSTEMLTTETPYCKGFWRRTVQRNLGETYRCRNKNEACKILPQSRGKCQRCRYLSCLKAGMVADLVMGEKVRANKNKLVEENRQRKREGSEAGLLMREQDQHLFGLATSVFNVYLANVGTAADVNTVLLMSGKFVESLLYQLMGANYNECVAEAAQMEVFYIHLAASRPSHSLSCVPSLFDLALAVQSSGILAPEVVLIQLLAATRPRLSWPPAWRYTLSCLWDMASAAVRRRVQPARLSILLQVVQQAATVNCHTGLDRLAALQYPQAEGAAQPEPSPAAAAAKPWQQPSAYPGQVSPAHGLNLVKEEYCPSSGEDARTSGAYGYFGQQAGSFGPAMSPTLPEGSALSKTASW